jgi:predicted GNAT family acetyltransferase
MDQIEPELRVVDNPAERRYEALVGDQPAGIVTYRLRPGQIVLLHTEVLPAFEGRGIGSRLAAGVLDDARSRGLSVVPRCPFIAAYIRRHPVYADLVAGLAAAPQGGGGS